MEGGGAGGGRGGGWEAGGRLNPSIPDIDVTFDGVRNLLLKSDLNKSAGADNIATCCFLKHNDFEAAPLLTHLFQQSLRNGIVPASWKQANVTPIIILQR